MFMPLNSNVDPSTNFPSPSSSALHFFLPSSSISYRTITHNPSFSSRSLKAFSLSLISFSCNPSAISCALSLSFSSLFLLSTPISSICLAIKRKVRSPIFSSYSLRKSACSQTVFSHLANSLAASWRVKGISREDQLSDRLSTCHIQQLLRPVFWKGEKRKKGLGWRHDGFGGKQVVGY